MKFGEKFKTERLKMNLTQKEVAVKRPKGVANKGEFLGGKFI